MPKKNTATLALNGKILLSDFSEAMHELEQIISILTTSVASEKIEWQLDGLVYSSAIATLKGVSARGRNGQQVESVITAFEDVGKAIQASEPIPHGVDKPVRKLLRLIGDRVTSIRFETQGFEAEFSGADGKGIAGQVATESSYGAVEGRIQSVSNREGLRFTLYDTNEDYAISCYVQPGREEILRNAWGKLASVPGVIRRSPITKRVTTVRDISALTVFDESKKNAYKEAFGCAPSAKGSISSVEAIRRVRDAR